MSLYGLSVGRCGLQIESVHRVCRQSVPSLSRAAFKSRQQKGVPVAISQPATLTDSRRGRLSVSASAGFWGENPEHADDDFIVVGLAQCYVKDEDSKLQEVFVIEPIPAAALECMDNGGVTSYLHAAGTTLGVALKEDPSLLPTQFQSGIFGDDFEYRALCAARTWKRPHAQEKLM